MRVGLGNDKVLVAVSAKIDNLVRHVAIVDLPIRSLDETEFVHPANVLSEADQADVRAFRRFDRADASVVRRMNVSNLEARAITTQTTRPSAERRRLWVSSASGFV